MKNSKRGVTFITLGITVAVLAIIATSIISGIRDDNFVQRAEWIVSETRERELEYAISEITSDYHLLSEKDATVRNMSLREYILQCLREDYGLTSSEENAITIDEDGNLTVNK